MIEIRLTPAGNLRWETENDIPTEAKLQRLHKAFDADWRDAVFHLAADRTDVGLYPALRYWQGIAESLLTRVCHLPEGMTITDVTPPTEAECGQWLLTAPPMPGGEYLSMEMLLKIWQALLDWCAAAISATESVQHFLEQHASKWHQVGRVCFHLAENKSDPERPFAFMATYISGLGTGGQPRHLPLGKALEQYAGAKNRPALLKLLAPVQAASERCDWVKEMVESRLVYQPMAWTPTRAYRFLCSVPALEDSGLIVRLPDWWKRRPRPRVSVSIGEKKPSLLGLQSVLDFDVAVALGDARLTRAETAALLSSGDGLVFFKGQWVEVDRDKLQEAIAHWESLREDAYSDGVSFIEGMRLLSGASPDLKQDAQEEERAWVLVEAGDALREILSGLREPARLDIALEGSLKATLRPYQRDGAAWLRFLTELGLGACLADDMGLGKTIQVLALLLQQRQSVPEPSLLVVPASLLGNWRSEAQRFAPALRMAFLHPSEADAEILARIEKNPQKELAKVDLAITTYSMLSRQAWLGDVSWRLLILDEAQAIKNPGTRQTQAVKKLPAAARVALTGTPIENRLGDLWSLFDFLNPGLLGSAKAFKSFVNTLQERRNDQFAPLRRLVAPYILRRLKTDRAIIADLPEKVETTRFCSLTKTQIQLYGQIITAMQDNLEKSEGIKRRAMILQTLMRLKQVCNHPSQLLGDSAYAPEESGKFIRLSEICGELAERQERVLVFTQFKEVIDALAAHLAGVFRREGLVLHGGTPVAKRKGLVEQFQREDGPPFMILSLKAGGTGLNLTAASHVIHFDRWWNPAVEDQATDRVFRIGQKKNVLVHKFVTSGSVEEKIDAMIAEKRQLAAELLSGGAEVDLTALDDEALMELVRLDIRRAAL